MTNMTAYKHCDVGIASLKLRRRFSPDELDAALEELFEKGYAAPCASWNDYGPEEGHENCVEILRFPYEVTA